MTNLNIRNWIGGEEVSSISSRTLDFFNPATGSVLGNVEDSSADDVDRAVKAARGAFSSWSRRTSNDRARILRQISNAIETNLDRLAKLESLNTGKPLQLARSVDIPRSALNFEFFAGAATQFSSESHQTDDQTLCFTRRDPMGVVACISPWNLPLYLLTWKMAPALAAGNTVVAKPSEITPATAGVLAELLKETELPDGVLNFVHGRGPELGPRLCSHPDVRAISFTGSTATGREIANLAAPHFKKVSLEMGGKNATIVFADADLKKALPGTLRSAFSNQGQICLCGSRILVEKSIYDTFREALVRETEKLKVGDPLEPETRIGAITSQAQFDKVCSAVSHAKNEGANVLTGGRSVQFEGPLSGGLFFEPTLIEGLSSSSATNQNEIFGPVATLIPFENEAEAVQIANDTAYGLSASVWTQNGDRGFRVARDLRVGMVWINDWMKRDLRTPFGGVKQSGLGREGGWEALRFFTEPKNVSVTYGEC